MIETWSSLGALWSAARRAARGKRRRSSVARALLELEGLLLRLQRELRTGSWSPARPSVHAVRDPKPRRIVAAAFEDRIVHQALCAAVGPLLDRHLIADTFACRTGLGTHAALARATRWARGHRFVAHLDVKKFFPSIDHAILFAQLRRAIPCEATLGVCRRIVTDGGRFIEPVRFHFPGDDLFAPAARAVGLPIGSLTSQHFANRFLSPVDHCVKDRLRVRAYLRYMDDMVLFDDDRNRLEDRARAVEEACHGFRLRLHPWEVRPTRAGLSFIGMRILPDQVRVRRSSVRRGERRLRELAEAARRGDAAAQERLTLSLRSTFAHWAHGDTWRLRDRVLHDLDLHAEGRFALDGERFLHGGADRADSSAAHAPEEAEEDEENEERGRE